MKEIVRLFGLFECSMWKEKDVKYFFRVLLGLGGHPEGYLEARRKWLAEALGL